MSENTISSDNRRPVISGMGKILSDINQIILKGKMAKYFNRFFDVLNKKQLQRM